MQFDYFDMLSGEPVFCDGVGHLRSPLLAELKPATGLGYKGYSLYLNFLIWDRDKLLQYNQVMKYKGAEKLDKDVFNAFDLATLLPPTRERCREVLSFFMTEDLVWDDLSRRFYVVAKDDGTRVGEITRKNFDETRRLMLQLNYIGVDKSGAPATFTDEKTKELWERSQQYLKAQAAKDSSAGKPEYHLGNIISKVCAIHPSYNALNIFGLTIFQVYDAFFQVGYMRATDLSERIFSNHGGEKFKFEDWLKPILKNI